jgi:Family of unknown function (DUF5946)
MDQRQDEYQQLQYYTLAHPGPDFIHQNAVDAHAAQTADDDTKPITVAFALVGLYLYIEKGYTGKQVLQAHMALAKRKRTCPTFDLPDSRGEITVADVMAQPPGAKRDAMIRRWCESVWRAYAKRRARVIALAETISGG